MRIVRSFVYDLLDWAERSVYVLRVDCGWDPAKAASNLAKHGVAFEAVDGFDWDSAIVVADTRADYGEVRLTATGAIGSRLHVLVYTIRRCVWVISLRRANRKEVMRYASES